MHDDFHEVLETPRVPDRSDLEHDSLDNPLSLRIEQLNARVEVLETQVRMLLHAHNSNKPLQPSI